MKRVIVMLLCAVLFGSAGCTQDDDGQDQTQPSPTSEATTTPEPTPCVLDDASTTERSSQTGGDVAQVTDVRWDDDRGCPRIVFEFQNQLADYKVAYTDDASECGSGEPPPSDGWGGEAFLSVRMEPAGGPDPASESGEPVYKGRRDIAVDGDVLKHLKVICDFEAASSG